MSELKLCINCKHYREDGLLVHCVRKVTSEQDMVSGKVFEVGEVDPNYARASSSKYACGPKAKFFEQAPKKEPLWVRAIQTFFCVFRRL